MDFYKRASIICQSIPYGSGILSGAASFETYDQQKLLLENEGITVIRTDKGWKTDLKKYQWKTTFDDALYFENLFKQANI